MKHRKQSYFKKLGSSLPKIIDKNIHDEELKKLNEKIIIQNSFLINIFIII